MVEQVRIANARRNNVIMDDDDDDDDNNNDDNMPNGNDHVLKENDNVENRPENRKTPREDKDKDTDEGEASKKQKVFEIHIDSDGNEGKAITTPKQPSFQQQVLNYKCSIYINERSVSCQVGSHRYPKRGRSRK